MRPSPQQRLDAIAAAATSVFGRLGYRRARTAEIAARAGVSAGSIFTYVDSKEALFHLVFAHRQGQPAARADELPFVAPPFTETLELIGRRLREDAGTPLLKAALSVDRAEDIAAELGGIVEERYETISRAWPLLAVIERSAVDLPELEELYFRRRRPGYLGQLTRYLESRGSSGQLKTFPDAAVVARIVTETITWFAWHRHEDRDAGAYDDALAYETVMAFVSDALVAS